MSFSWEIKLARTSNSSVNTTLSIVLFDMICLNNMNIPLNYLWKVSETKLYGRNPFQKKTHHSWGTKQDDFPNQLWVMCLERSHHLLTQSHSSSAGLISNRVAFKIVENAKNNCVSFYSFLKKNKKQTWIGRFSIRSWPFVESTILGIRSICYALAALVLYAVQPNLQSNE
jgi:hypothetical protein